MPKIRDNSILNNLVSSISRIILLTAFLINPVIGAAYIGDYDGIIVTEPIELKGGEEFRFDGVSNGVDGQRIEIGIQPASTGKTDWILVLDDTVHNHSISLHTRLIERNKYDFDHDESIAISLSIDGEELLNEDFGKRLPISKSPIYLRVQSDGDEIIVSAGDHKLETAGRVSYSGFIDRACISSKYDIVINRYSSLYIPGPAISRKFLDETAVMDALHKCTDIRCGIWEYFDEEVETRIAMKGGRYKLALLPSENGGYDLIYLSGAEINPARWHAGAIKGHLALTPFADTFTLYWVDSSGKEIFDQTPYAAIEGAIMSLVFPLQKARFRFVRTN